MTALVLASTSVFAQDNNGKRDRGWQDRWKAEKIAFLTDAMDLTSAEAERFWPIYNKAEAEKRESFKLVMDSYKALEEALVAGKDEKEVSALLDRYLDAQEAGKDIDRKYTAEYRKILSGKKVAKLFIGEEAFRRQQIHRLNKNDKEGKNEKK